MVPSKLASEAFRLFMVIPKERIKRDTTAGLEQYETARKLTIAFYDTEDDDRTAEQCAEFMHAELVMGCIALAHPEAMHPDVAFHLVGAGARGAARTALFAAGKTGELGKLNEEMDRIREASGIEDFDEQDEFPEEYTRLSERAGELLDKIERMMVSDILKRYGLHEQAELFEADEEAFDARVGEGYYVLYPEKRKHE